MLDHDDLKWIAATSTELNSILQQVARYSDLARRHKGEHNYIDLLGERVEIASKTAQQLFDRVTSKILASTTVKAGAGPTSPHTPFTVLPPPIRAVQAASIAGRLPVTVENFEPKSAASLAPSPVATIEASPDSSGIPSDLTVKNPHGSGELLLLVEDETDVADLAAEMLAEEGYKLVIAHNGVEALRIYQRIGRQIALVILDFFLPVMDGDAVFDELRAMNPNVTVVLSSGFAEQHKISAMLAQGLRGFIPKPYTREKLLSQVRSTIDAAREGMR